MERYSGAILILALILLGNNYWQTPAVLGEESSPPTIVLPADQPTTTQSRFSQKLAEQTEIIPKKTVYQDDPEIEAGEDKVLEDGGDGKITKIIKITYYMGKEYSKEVASTETIPAVDKKILRGIKIVWKILDTEQGEIKYWKKLRVYATHYDQHCLGCNEWTAIGMRAGKGVIAVDPKIIPMRSKIYVPGYGMAVAGDTGGAIKGNIIDLGFDDARTAGWSAKFVDIYLL